MSAELTTCEYTPDQARRFTDEIKRDGSALWQKVAEAYDGRIWVALGYESGQRGWQRYIADEFPDGLLIPPRERQNEAIHQYLQQGMSTRAIAQVTDLNHVTVARRAQEIRDAAGRSGVANATPGNVQGIDGKQYASSQPNIFGGNGEDTVEDVEVVDEVESPAVPEASNGHVSGGDVHGAAAGFEDLGLQNTNGKLEIKQETPEKVLRAFNGTGSSDVKQIRGTAYELKMFLFAAGVEAGAWDQVDLAEVVDDTGDTVAELVDLLLAMAAPNETGGVSQQALRESALREPNADTDTDSDVDTDPHGDPDSVIQRPGGQQRRRQRRSDRHELGSQHRQPLQHLLPVGRQWPRRLGLLQLYAGSIRSSRDQPRSDDL